MKATEQVVLPVVLFTLLHKVVLTFEYVDEILNGDNSNEYWAIVLVMNTVYYAVQGGSSFRDCCWNPRRFQLKKITTEQYFPLAQHITLYKEVLAFETANEC